MSLTPKSFELVEVNTSEIYACSPTEKLPGWNGIEINVPEVANFIGKTEDVFMPICGYSKLPLAEIEKHGPMVIHIASLASSKTYSGQVIIVDESPEEPIPGVIEEPNENIDPTLVLGSYFNTDLLEFVRFPFLTGNYEVWVEYGGATSNVAQLTMKFQ